MHHAGGKATATFRLAGRKGADFDLRERTPQTKCLSHACDLLRFELDAALREPTVAFAPRLLPNLDMRASFALNQGHHHTLAIRIAWQSGQDRLGKGRHRWSWMEGGSEPENQSQLLKCKRRPRRLSTVGGGVDRFSPDFYDEGLPLQENTVP